MTDRIITAQLVYSALNDKSQFLTLLRQQICQLQLNDWQIIRSVLIKPKGSIIKII